MCVFSFSLCIQSLAHHSEAAWGSGNSTCGGIIQTRLKVQQCFFSVLWLNLLKPQFPLQWTSKFTVSIKDSVAGVQQMGAATGSKGLPSWLSGKESTCQCRRRGFDPWVRKIPWDKKWQRTPLFLPWQSHGQKRLAGYSPWHHKRVRHNWVTKQQKQLASVARILSMLVGRMQLGCWLA